MVVVVMGVGGVGGVFVVCMCDYVRKCVCVCVGGELHLLQPRFPRQNVVIDDCDVFRVLDGGHGEKAALFGMRVTKSGSRGDGKGVKWEGDRYRDIAYFPTIS